MAKPSEIEKATKQALQIVKSASTGLAFNRQQLAMGQLQIAATDALIKRIEKLTETIRDFNELNQEIEILNTRLTIGMFQLSVVIGLMAFIELTILLTERFDFPQILQDFLILGELFSMIALMAWIVWKDFRRRNK